jgi:CMP-N,N'-diacetyllegionaminic acid synthase
MDCRWPRSKHSWQELRSRPLSVVAIIPARGGSRAIPKKNLMPICGKPLIAWSIAQARAASSIDQVYVTSDSEEILEAAASFGARPILRPAALATDQASSESAWLHAVDQIEKSGTSIRLVVAMQATSPVRESSDLDGAIKQFWRDGLDSLLSCCEVEDFFMWRLLADGQAASTNHDFTQRAPRQTIEKRYLENGSFYLFAPELLRKAGNRLGGRIGLFVMARHKLFQIDNPEDARLCEVIMRGYGLANR